MLKSALKGMLLFVLVGPLIGLIAFIVPFITKLPAENPSALIAENLYNFSAFIAAVYAVSGLPALITGLIVGCLRTRLGELSGYIISGIVGSAVSAGFYFLLMGLVATRGAAPYIAFPQFAAVPGFFAGFVCGWIFLRRPLNKFIQADVASRRC